MFGLVGINRSENRYRVNKEVNEDDKVLFDKNNTIYGARITLNAFENIMISVGFEISKFDDLDNNKHTVNVYNINVGYQW